MIVLKKTSSLVITDAEQISETIPNMEILVTGGEKNSNSLFNKETCGDIKYHAYGFVSLFELQFISMDIIKDRFFINADDVEYFKNVVNRYLPEPVTSNGFDYYRLKNSADTTPENGILFSNENIKYYVKDLFKRILQLRLKGGSCAYADLSKLKIKYVYDPIVDTKNNPDGWIEIKTFEDIDNLNFESEIYYTEVENGKELRSEIDKIYFNKIDNNNSEKTAKKEGKLKSKKTNEDE